MSVRLQEKMQSILKSFDDKFEIQFIMPNGESSSSFVFGRLTSKDFITKLKKLSIDGNEWAIKLALATRAIDGEDIDIDAEVDMGGTMVDNFSWLYDFYMSLPPDYLQDLYNKYDNYIIPDGGKGFITIVKAVNNVIEESSEKFDEPHVVLTTMPDSK